MYKQLFYTKPLYEGEMLYMILPWLSTTGITHCDTQTPNRTIRFVSLKTTAVIKNNHPHQKVHLMFLYNKLNNDYKNFFRFML